MDDGNVLPPEKKRRTEDDDEPGMEADLGNSRDSSPFAFHVNTTECDYQEGETVELPRELLGDWAATRNTESGHPHDSINRLVEGDVQEDEEEIAKEPSNDNVEERNDSSDEAAVEERTLDWDAIRQHRETRDHVDQYWNAKQRREQAQERFNTMLDEVDAAYAKCIDAVLSAAGQVHQEQRQDALDAMEAELMKLFVGNDRMRTQMQRDLERSSKQWQYSLFNLMASLQSSSGTDAMANTLVSWILDTMSRFICNYWSDHQPSAHPVLHLNEPDRQVPSPAKGADEENSEEYEEPDWDGIMQRHPPAAAGIRRFLASREQLESIDAKFAKALDDIHLSLKANIAVVIDTAVRIYEENAHALDATEDQLLDHFEYNHQQRTWMQQTLEDSAEKAQQHFANLMFHLQQHHEPEEPQREQQSVEQQEQQVSMPMHTVEARGAW